jgi:hypothetical protein
MDVTVVCQWYRRLAPGLNAGKIYRLSADVLFDFCSGFAVARRIGAERRLLHLLAAGQHQPGQRLGQSVQVAAVGQRNG